MKFLSLALLTQLAFTSMVFAQTPTKTSIAAPAESHGGGNGGDDLELELKKRSLQIGYFLKSTVGTQTFKMINADAVVETIENSDIDVVTGNVTDKYGALRTCVNEPERALITCNLSRIDSLIKNKKTDVLTATLFHEILGLMGLELGYQENVSMYPISSKILPYNSIVESTVVSEANIRPEYYGLDSRSYGLTLENKETKETIRMICLNDNVEVNRCRNYSVVRKANGLQSPLANSVASISPAKLAQINMQQVKSSDLIKLEERLTKVQSRGFEYLTLSWQKNNGCGYAYGIGFTQELDGVLDGGCWDGLALVLIPAIIDTTLEIPKQAGNIAIWPLKAIVSGIKSASLKNKIKKANASIDTARQVLNLDNELSRVGTSKAVSNEEFTRVTEVLKLAITQ